jgi:hypothetical protein
MQCIAVLRVLITVCFSVNMYSMEQQDNIRAVNKVLEAQHLYDNGQKVIAGIEFKLKFTHFGNQDEYNTFVETEKNRANHLFCKSRRRIERILDDQNVDEVTKKTVLDIEKKIDAIPWVSK